MAISYEESDRYTQVAGASMHSNEAGKGPALLCFHGGGPGANAWDNTRRNLDALAAHFSVVLLDLPGYGRSEQIDALPGETQDRMLARALLAFMDERNIERAHFYGTSMSASPIVRFCLDHPQRVNRLVMKSPGLAAPNLLTPTPPDGIVALGTFNADPTRENMAAMMRLFVPRTEALTEDMIESRFQSAIRTREASRPVNAPLPSAPLYAELGELQPRTLVLWGHQDHMVPIDGALLALALIPDVRVHLWGGRTGHFIEWEHTEEWNRLVIDFLLA